jgi:hypothetical protein
VQIPESGKFRDPPEDCFDAGNRLHAFFDRSCELQGVAIDGVVNDEDVFIARLTLTAQPHREHLELARSEIAFFTKRWHAVVAFAVEIFVHRVMQKLRQPAA